MAATKESTPPDKHAVIDVLLRNAIVYLKEARAKMDTSSSECAHCNRPTYNAWVEHQAAEKLDGSIEKLERMAGVFRASAESKKSA